MTKLESAFTPNLTDPVDQKESYKDDDYDDNEPRRICIECGEPLEDDNWSEYCDTCLKKVLKEF